MIVTGNQWLVFTVPSPISTNALYRSLPRGGRVKTTIYKNWIELAGWEIKRQLGPKIPYCPFHFLMDITLGGYIDIDNIKCLPDICKTMRLIRDDRYMIDLHVRREIPAHPEDRECTIRMRPEGCEWIMR